MLFLLSTAFSNVYAQLRPAEDSIPMKKIGGKGISILFQIEPAFTFTSISYKDINFPDSLDFYNTSISGINLSIMPKILDRFISQDSTTKIEARIRTTIGFWHFKKVEDTDLLWFEGLFPENCAPLEIGADLGMVYPTSDKDFIIPYIGFQYGMIFHIGGDFDDNLIDKMYTIRLGADYVIAGNVRLGLSYVINRVNIEFDGFGQQMEGQLKYNQLALGITF